MKTLTVTQVARNFSSVIDQLEQDQEEVILVRNEQTVARLVPEPNAQTALEVLGDLHRTMDDETAEALLKGLRKARKGKNQTLAGMRTTWDS